MADDEEYDEVDAVVRIRKGERLANSRKTEGWSRGFTPKSASKGPEYVEIRLKDESDSLAEQEPDVMYVTEYVEAPRPGELSVAEQVAVDFLSRVIDELIGAAAEAVVARWWNTCVTPAVRAKREDFLLKRGARRVEKARRTKATARTLILDQVLEDVASSQQQVAAASDDPKITMTSAGRLQVPGSCGWSGCDRLGRIAEQARAS